MSKAITLLSGGLDSAVATALAAKRHKITIALTFDYGQRAAKQEIAATKGFCRKLKIDHIVVDFRLFRSITKSALVSKKKRIPEVLVSGLEKDSRRHMKAVWVPNRNGVFISIAAAYAESEGCDLMITGFNMEEAEEFPDNSVRFISAMNKSLECSTLNHVKIYSPTAKMAKSDIAKKFVQLGLDAKYLWSCYLGGEKFCGKCESCSRLIRAFTKINCLHVIEEKFL